MTTITLTSFEKETLADFGKRAAYNEAVKMSRKRSPVPVDFYDHVFRQYRQWLSFNTEPVPFVK